MQKKGLERGQGLKLFHAVSILLRLGTDPTGRVDYP